MSGAIEAVTPESTEGIEAKEIFEQEVRTFLSSIGCTSVKGGRGFSIAQEGQHNQIDACGRYNKILFIVECTAANRRSSKPISLRGKIMELNTKIQLAKQGYKQIPEYADCETIVPIFATKKYTLTESDEKLLEKGIQGQQMFHIDENFLQYYQNLADMIGYDAIFNILYEFNINPPQDEKLVVDAIKTNIKGYSCYLFYALPKELLKFAYVARRRLRNEKFYQRALDKSRLSKIRDYIEKEGKFFPTNLVISLKGHGKYYFAPSFKAYPTSPNFELGKLEIRNRYATCWIIDGQHRLYSFAKSDIEFPVPCLAIEDPPFDKERDFFIDINKEQKRVPSDLIWDVEGEKDPECKTTEGLISNVVKLLDEENSPLWRSPEERSPFIGKIDMPSNEKESPTMKISAFCNGIYNANLAMENLPDKTGGGNNMLAEGKGKTSRDRMAKTIAKYFNILNEKLSADTPLNNELRSLFLGNGGVPILLYVLEPILSRIYDLTNASVPSREQFRQYTNLVVEYFSANYKSPQDVKKLKKFTTSEGARKETAEEIGRYIKAQLRDPLFWPNLGNSWLSEKIGEIEAALRNMVADKLYGIDPEWQKHRVPQAIYESIKKEQAQGNSFQDHLDIGETRDIIKRNDNWDAIFKNIFTGDKVFQDKEEFSIACDVLSRNRAPPAHYRSDGRSIENKAADLDLCEGFIKKFRIILKDYLEEGERE
ncbi:MAG: DGQHR domain-containing protein [Candidatus Micrarchaeia archaeon]